MIRIQSTPNAPILIESMRSLGYSFEMAIADLIDNCVSAQAKHVKIIQKPSSTPELIIFDDGNGMDEKELEESLRFGSRNPNESRDENDLGRYGLGMKSASLSQCRQLIVASKKDGKISCFSWDVDVVNETNDWSVIQYDESEIRQLPSVNLFDLVEHGTYVLLRKFDRIAESAENIEDSMQEHVGNVRRHLSLVFHRIMTEDGLKIDINGNEIEPRDPFLENHHGTQKLQTEKIIIDGAEIIAQPYILPHMNNLSKEDVERIGGKDDLRANQGFYIYRCKRLIIWGSWFNLESKREINKLARVKVDIPNSLDSIWEIDVKKSTASIPPKIRRRLANTIADAIFKSGRTITHRRSLNVNSDCTYIWNREVDREDNAIYTINMKSPQLQMFYDTLSIEQQRLFENIIKNIESNLLLTNMYADAAAEKLGMAQANIDDMIDDFNMNLDLAVKQGIDRDNAIATILKAQPYVDYEGFEKEWRKRQ